MPSDHSGVVIEETLARDFRRLMDGKIELPCRSSEAELVVFAAAPHEETRDAPSRPFSVRHALLRDVENDDDLGIFYKGKSYPFAPLFLPIFIERERACLPRSTRRPPCRVAPRRLARVVAAANVSKRGRNEVCGFVERHLRFDSRKEEAPEMMMMMMMMMMILTMMRRRERERRAKRKADGRCA